MSDEDDRPTGSGEILHEPHACRKPAAFYYNEGTIWQCECGKRYIVRKALLFGNFWVSLPEEPFEVLNVERDQT